MKTLAIETSTLTGSVALIDITETEKKVMGEITLSVSAQHSERLLPMVDSLLSQCTCTLQAIDLFAVSVGPGSFTGLRIGIAAAQGFSLSTGKPLVGVSSLKALAMNAFGFSGVILPMFNAFRGEVYTGLYRSTSGTLELLGDEGAVKPEVLREEITKALEKSSTNFMILGNGVEIAKSVMPQNVQIAPMSLQVPRASHVALLAHEKWAQNPQQVLLEPVLPNYLRIPG